MNAIKSTTRFSVPLICLVIGIYGQSVLSTPLHILGITSIPILLGLVLAQFAHIQKASFVLVNLLFILTGSSLLKLQKTKHDLVLNNYSNRSFNVIARVANKEQHTEKTYNQTALIDIEQVQETNQQHYQPAHFSLLCYTKSRFKFEVDDTIELKDVMIKPTTNASLSGNPTFTDFLVKENILSTIFISKKNTYRVITHPNTSLNRWLWEKTTSLYTSLHAKLSSTAATYYELIFLGNKQEGHIEPLRERFNLWGLSHYLARSGLHIVLFILIWRFLLNLIPLHLTFKRIALVLLCLIYHFFSWPSISFLRAYYVFLFMQTGALLKQQVNFFHLLTLVCIFTLLLNPMQLFFLDFQLSFGLTFALSWQSQLT